MPQSTADRPRKRTKLDQSLQVRGRYTFTSAEDIQQALRVQDPNVLPTALSALRAKLSVRPGETIPPHDERLNLVKVWMEAAPGAKDLFEICEGMHQPSTRAIVVSLLSAILSLLSSHFPYHSYGIPIIKTILSPQWMRWLNSHLSGTHNELILASLRLVNTISAFGSGRERKSLFETFHWDNKSLQKLLHMRRKGKGGEEDDLLARPDIRTSYVLLLLSFIDQDSPSSVKAAFLEQRRELFMGIFKGLFQDHYSVIQKVLQVCWDGLWSDPKVKRTLKVGVFNEVTVSHLLKLYDRAVAEKQDGQHVPADVVHHFLLAICTRPGQGICFRDRGWYPRETDDNSLVDEEDAESSRQKGGFIGRVYNKILSNILRTLKVNEDARQQELALKITAACPELVAGYWPGAALTLEPRLSSKWIANITFAGQVLSQPVPTSSFLIPGTELYKPTPPPLSTIMANVLPSVGTKAHFTKGLQAASAGLVQHCTALVLIKCLRKLAEVVRVFEAVEVALEESEDEGQWNRRRKEVEKEARKRVPEFQVIVAFSQQNMSAANTQNTTKHALLSEASQRLLWLCQGCLPDVVAEARFEVGKLVLNLAEGSFASLSLAGEARGEEVGKDQRPSALQSVKQLHVLRLLIGNDQFTWAGKVASSSHTYLYVLLRTFCNTRVRALRTTLHALLRHIFTESVLFQEDPDEVDLWLAALPSGEAYRGPETETPDSTPLTDEVDGVVTFLDDCLQRCLKTPYRYMEAMSDLLQSHSELSDTSTHVHVHTETFASPLLMTILEQITAKASGKLISPSDTLAVFVFVRRLLAKLASKQGESGYGSLLVVLAKLDAFVSDGQLSKECPSIGTAILRELSIADACLGHLEDRSKRPRARAARDDAVVNAFLNRIEQVPVPASEPARITGAYELVDWLRIVDFSPTPADIARLASVIQRFHKPALKFLVDNLHPSESALWGSGLLGSYDLAPIVVDFDWLFFHSGDAHLEDKNCRATLLNALFSRPITCTQLERAICLIIHGVSVSQNCPGLTRNLLFLLSALLVRAKMCFNKEDLLRVKLSAVVHSTVIYGFCVSDELSAEVHEALQHLVHEAFDGTDEEDKKTLLPISAHWLEVVKGSLTSGQHGQLRYAKPWVKFMGRQDLLSALELTGTGTLHPSPLVCNVLEEILATLQQTTSTSRDSVPVDRLLTLRNLLPGSVLLEAMIADSLTSLLPYGCDGSVSFSDGLALSSIRHDTRGARSHDLHTLSQDLISEFLEKEAWTDCTAIVITSLLYLNGSSLGTYNTWLNSSQWRRHAIEHLTTTLAAFLDCMALEEGKPLPIEDTTLAHLFDQLVPTRSLPKPTRLRRLQCICRILQLAGTQQPRLASTLRNKLQNVSIVHLAFESTFIARRILELPSCESLATDLVDRSLQWAVRHCADEAADDEDVEDIWVDLENIARRTTKLKAHLVEPLLAAIIQNRLSSDSTVKLAVTLVNSTSLKPVVVNRFLQNILQHQFFLKICSGDGTPSQKDQVIRLLDALFALHPTNTCQPSHVEPLFRIYRGTMSSCDRHLLSIFRLFEAEKRTSLSSLFARWSPSPETSTSVTNALEVIQNLDPVRMLRTCLAFPTWRRFGEEKYSKEGPTHELMYDPLVVVALSAQMLVESPPTSALGWVKVFRTNIASLLIRCLSSKDPNIRELALCQIARLWETLQDSDMQERAQVLYVLRMLKNVIPASTTGRPHRLPTYTTLILLHALRGIFYPSNFIYPRTARFLLQRPELDVSDVPMLFGMLYSSNSDEWKKERGWILRMLADGMMSTEDWRVLKRRHTWDLLASLYQSTKRDGALRAGILEVLANLTCNVQACTSLVLKSALLSWIEMQLGQGDGTVESISWLKILENIVFTADTSKLERAMQSEWRFVTCRCLCRILEMDTEKDIRILDQAVAVMLRLSLIPGVTSHNYLLAVLKDAVKYLVHLESSIHFHSRVVPKQNPTTPASLPPHHSQGLHELPVVTDADRFMTWGKVVEALWRVSMTPEERTNAWEALTRRLLVCRSVVGEGDCPVGEWARKGTVRALRTSNA
ncbi:ribosome 60S biogenesis N-terminal-domain-containing protein [Phlebopus sp. FC_14]|nr:ribosome 60S biogenesis N-terminal-domain-containing protein [Phlebopus sp. FC_14]